MVMIRCSANQHFFDPEKHDDCPYCRGVDGPNDTRSMDTRGLVDNYAVAPEALGDATTPMVGLGAGQNTERLVDPTVAQAKQADPAGETVGIFRKVSGFEPVVGWLVCTEGPEKGQDFRIKPGVNEIGRKPESAGGIALGGDDKAISRRWHAVIEYFDRENEFFLNRKDNPEVWLNGNRVLSLTKLESFDRLQFGGTPYVFISLCSESFKWLREI